MAESTPTLWHIEVSHYSEKVRWALDHKRIAHKRRALTVPGAHIPAALWMTGGAHNTFPVLELDGQKIGDSTAIIALLEERYPQSPLYPADPEERRRALALEDFFDEELAPHVRLLAFHELANDPERFEAVIRRVAPKPLAQASAASARYFRAFTSLRYGTDSAEAAEEARAKILVAFDRLEEELGEGDYLVGDTFTVADLSAAALFHPFVLPDEGPLPADEQPPAGLERFRAPLKERRGFKWVEEMFHRHRKPTKVAAAATTG